MLGIALIVSFVFSEVFKEIRFPIVAAQIIAGLVLGIPIIKSILFDAHGLYTVDFLSKLGILFLLFLTGFEVNIKKIFRWQKIDETKITFCITFRSRIWSDNSFFWSNGIIKKKLQKSCFF